LKFPYEKIYARHAGDGLELYRNLKQYYQCFNEETPKEALGYKTPSEYYYEKALEGAEELE
jgi:hypothetical protein